MQGRARLAIAVLRRPCILLTLLAAPRLLSQTNEPPPQKQVVEPGDAVLQLPEGGEVHLGSGLRPVGDVVVALKCGVVRQTQRGKLWLEGRQKR